jgi:hypothetical protein
MTAAYALQSDYRASRPALHVAPPVAGDEWTAACIVLDARIAVATDCAASLRPSDRSVEVTRWLGLLANAAWSLEAFFDAIVAAEREGDELVEARACLAAACDWCRVVAGLIRDVAEADEARWPDVRDAAAAASSSYVRRELAPRMAACEAACSGHAAVLAACLRLQGDIVVLNWALRF